MARDYFMLHYDFLEATEALTMEERGRLITAILNYCAAGALPEKADMGNERFVFPTFRAQADRDIAAYEKRVRINRENGMKGGRPTSENPVGSFAGQYKEKDQYEEKEEYKDEEQEEGEYRPASPAPESPPAPALNEVLDFCRENGMACDGERFWNYYQSVGWMAGRTPIRDWRAKLREWEVRDKREKPLIPSAVSAAPRAQNYIQRGYTDADYGEDFYLDLSGGKG